MRSPFALALIGVACLLAAPVHAQAGERSQRASERFAEGREAMKRGDYPLASMKFEQSQRLDPSLGTLLNLAVCEQHLGHLLKARALLEQFFDNAAPHDDRRASAEELANDITAKLPQLVVNVEPSGLPSTWLSVDGRDQRFLSGASLALDPGTHQIEFSAVGFRRRRITVTLAEAEHHELHIVLESQLKADSSPQPTPAPRTPPARPNSGLPPGFYGALSVGLAGALTVAGSGVMIAHERSTVREHCTDKSCDPVGLAAGDRGSTWVVVNTVAWPVALAGASLAAYLVLFRDKHAKPQYGVGLAANPAQPALFFEGRL